MSSIPCAGGCGFFGNPNTANMCSVCFRAATGGAPPSGGKPSGLRKPSTLKAQFKENGVSFQIRHGDMTTETVDAIVNAANASLDHASGLAGAICKYGGDTIQYESDVYLNKYGKLDEGQVMSTSAGKLPCKHVIHAVGPMWHGGKQGEDILLGMTVRSCLAKADELKCASISLPAISSGIFGFPKDKCANIMIDMSRQYVKEMASSTHLKEIRFTNFDDTTLGKFMTEVNTLGLQSLSLQPDNSDSSSTKQD